MHGYPVVPASFIEKIILSPIEWCWSLCCISLPFMYVSILYSITTLSELLLLYSNFLNWQVWIFQLFSCFSRSFGYSSSLVFPCEFQDTFVNFCKRAIWNFDWRLHWSVNQLGSMAVLTILSLLIDSWQWDIFPFIYIFLNFFQQCLTAFSVCFCTLNYSWVFYFFAAATNTIVFLILFLYKFYINLYKFHF